MSMLAERRFKQKYSIDPRNTAWTNDTNKFGQRMMESLGWAPGKGLGAKEDGRTEHVRITKKVDNRGIGCTKPNSDAWTAHTDDFNDLLKNLSKEHATAGEEPVTKRRNMSVPQKSRYGKHSKLNDVNKYGAADLASILGKRKKTKRRHSTSKDAASESANKNEIPKEDSKDGAEKSEHGVTTITNKSSMQEYFAEKMEAIRMKRLKNEVAPNIEPSGIDNCRKQFFSDEDLQLCSQDEDCADNITLDGKHSGEIEGKESSAVDEIICKSQKLHKKSKQKVKEGSMNTAALIGETRKKRVKKNVSVIAENCSDEDREAFNSWVHCGTVVNSDGPSNSKRTKQKKAEQKVKGREKETLDKVIEEKPPSKKNRMTDEMDLTETVSKKKRLAKERQKTVEQVDVFAETKTRLKRGLAVEYDGSKEVLPKKEHVEDEEIREASRKKKRSKKRKAQDTDTNDTTNTSKNIKNRELGTATEQLEGSSDCPAPVAAPMKSNALDDASSLKEPTTASSLRSKMDAFKQAMESNPVATVDREAVQAAVDAAVKEKLARAAAARPARSKADRLRDIASMEAAATEGVREAEQRRRAGRQVSRERVLAQFPGSSLNEVPGYATLDMIEARDCAGALTATRPDTS